MSNFVTMKSVAFIVFLLLMVLGSCQRQDNAITGGGKGGSAVLSIIPEHSNLYVDSCMIYIKYGTLDAPAAGVSYDDSAWVRMVDTLPIATFRGLTKGLYYMYAQGYHVIYSSKVKGGLNWTVSKQDSETVFVPTFSY